MYVSTYVIPQFASPAATKIEMMRTRRLPVSSWIASSSAYFASDGGASAVAVAARSENTERNVRRR